MNINAYLGTGELTNARERAAAAWRRISEKPAQITIVRLETALSPQTVRIEFSDTVREKSGGAGKSSVRDVIVFGVQGHGTVPDTNIQRDDLFAYEGARYRVIDVVLQTGEIQARCEAMN